MNGVSLDNGSRIKTKTGREAYVISLHANSGKVRIKYLNGLIKKVSADSVSRY